MQERGRERENQDCWAAGVLVWYSGACYVSNEVCTESVLPFFPLWGSGCGKMGERDTEEILRVTGTFLEKMLEATVCFLPCGLYISISLIWSVCLIPNTPRHPLPNCYGS